MTVAAPAGDQAGGALLAGYRGAGLHGKPARIRPGSEKWVQQENAAGWACLTSDGPNSTIYTEWDTCRHRAARCPGRAVTDPNLMVDA
jgi:hypothetical protein